MVQKISPFAIGRVIFFRRVNGHEVVQFDTLVTETNLQMMTISECLASKMLKTREAFERIFNTIKPDVKGALFSALRLRFFMQILIFDEKERRR